MKYIFKIVLLISLCYNCLGQSGSYIKRIKDTINYHRFGKIVFLQQDSLHLHVLLNAATNYIPFVGVKQVAYYVKFSKGSGQILNVKVFSGSNFDTRVTAACLYKSMLYFGGELNPFTSSKKAFIAKLNTQTGIVLWQRDFSNAFANPSLNSNTYNLSELQLNRQKDGLDFALDGSLDHPIHTISQRYGMLRGKLDTNNSNFSLMIEPYSGINPATFFKLTNVKFVRVQNSDKACGIANDSLTNELRLIRFANLSQNNYFNDNLITTTVVTNGIHFAERLNSRILFVADHQSGTTLIVTDTLCNILSTKKINNHHARSVITKPNSAYITMVNDLTSGKACEIVLAELDTNLILTAIKRMDIDTFRLETFTLRTTFDNAKIYHVFNKKNAGSADFYLYACPFNTVQCNEMTKNFTLSPVAINTVISALSATGTTGFSSLTVTTSNRMLKDSSICFNSYTPYPLAGFMTIKNVLCIGDTIYCINVSMVNPSYYTYYFPGASTPTVSNQSTPLVSYSVPGVYNITLTASNAFGSTSYVNTLTVVANPTITVSGGTICMGSSFTITPSGATNYTFSSGTAVVSPSLITNYTITATGNNNCPAVPVVCQVIPLPTPTLNLQVTRPEAICVGETNILYVNGANSYTWSNGSLSNSINVVAITNTIYIVKGTNSAGCTDSITYLQKVKVCVGLEQYAIGLNEISIYPNPTNKTLYFTLRSSGVAEWCRVQLFNTIGQLVHDEELNFTNGEAGIDVADLPVGVYTIHFRCSEFETYNSKLVIAR